ncbi:cobalamin biosynthesis protein [Actinomadura sp. NEAU-AAG7]|uniref:cobalamin biosynthesis protein n=1 Tax=Actinomadura sp. NEAU-AAG7 TaxID=2839640 RepID=UPI001BE41C68|nr:cobalamin biosynthesis protein [Actinomadura sp. NEAU-AAG7]MBT2208688.1 cobalamin biosynthesis protein [Actinomadura sp. NEAU-AAG7]
MNLTRVSPEGLLLGAGLDHLLGDPRRGHPVAGFGRAASWVERRVYKDSRARGVVFVGIVVGGALGVGVVLDRVGKGAVSRAVVTGVVTWSVLGGTSLGREGLFMASALERGDLEAARGRLSHLCARDPKGLESAELARATVESVAENTSDAAIAPLFWGAVAGVPGLVVYRAVNTLDAMVGYRNARYERFGWAAAKLDDVANWIPARVTGLLTVACSGSADAWRVLRRDGANHPSPNAGRCEAAFAGALGVRLGGANSYGGEVERRPEMGDGRAPEVRDVRRAVRLSKRVGLAAAGTAALVAWRLR